MVTELTITWTVDTDGMEVGREVNEIIAKVRAAMLDDQHEFHISMTRKGDESHD